MSQPVPDAGKAAAASGVPMPTDAEDTAFDAETSAAMPLVPVPVPEQPAAAVSLTTQGATDLSAQLVSTPGRLTPQPPAKPPSAGRRPQSTPGAAESKMCNCRNSKCLKLYCECFASGRYCSACNCVNCMNNTANEAARSQAIELILERNPNAFRPKIQFQPGDDGTQQAKITRHSKGCSCRKSHCLKKYCECFQATIFCSVTCRCKDCRNYEGSAALAAVMEAAADATGLAAPSGLPSRSTSGVLAPVPPDAKRPRSAARSTGGGMHPSQTGSERSDSARDAINNLRGLDMHRVLANMLTSLHSEALAKEHEKQHQETSNGVDSTAAEAEAHQAGTAPAEEAAAAAAATPVPDGSLSKYYEETEGTLLGEFGTFLGNLADKIEEQTRTLK